MASKLPVWGIDVGQCLLKAVKLQAAGDQVQMLAFDVVEHESILSEAEADATALITKAISTFASRNDFRGARIAVAVPGQQTLTRFTKMPPVEQKKIPDMVQYEASQQIPFDMDEVVWDYQVFTEKDSPDVEVGIFAIRKELIRNYISNFTDHKIEPMIVQTSPMASYNAMRYESPPPEGEATVLLDMGALATDLIVMEGNRIWSRPIPIGGNRFTEALVSAFKISFKKAEKLKRTAATSKYARQVFAAMRPVFGDLVSEVQRSIGFYTSTHRETHITRIIGMGNAFKLPGLQKFLQQNLSLEVDRFTSFKKLVTTGADASPAFAENIMSLSVAYGLALQGLDLASVQSNLLPTEVRRTLLWRKKQPWFIASAACLGLGAGALYVGNVMAEGEIGRAMGSATRTSPQMVATVEDADRIINSKSPTSPVDDATKLLGAAQKLQQELSQLNSVTTGDPDLFKLMIKITDNNVYVPRLVDVIHRALAATAIPEVSQAKNPAEYAELAKRMNRVERREIWIDKLDMFYDSKDPGELLGLEPPKNRTPGPKGGWGIRVQARITDPKPAEWIENTLIPTLTRLGREPNRGFFVDYVTLGKVMSLQSTADLGTELSGGGSEGTVAPPSQGGRGATGRGGGRGAAAQEPTETGGRGGGRGSETPAGGGEAPSEQVSKDPIVNLKQKFAKQDPLTGEPFENDRRFILNIVVRKGAVPANLVPDEFKPKPKTPAKEGEDKGT